MSASATIPTSTIDLTEADIMADLEAGRSLPLVAVRPAPPASALHADGADAPHRPALGGPAFRATWTTVQSVGRLNARVARPALEALWFTPWTVVPERRLPEGAVRRTYRAGGFALAGWELGEGPTVLLVHGWGARSTEMKAVAEAVAGADFRAVAFDLPAHGRSPGQRTHLVEFGQAVRAVASVVGTLHGIVAHSLGSAGAVMALADGVEAERLVLLAPPRRLQHAVARFAEAARLTEAVANDLRRVIEKRFGPTVWEDLAVDALAGDVRVTSLVVHDAGDREVPIEDGRAVAEALDAQFVMTEGLGHGRALVDPDVLARVVSHLSR